MKTITYDETTHAVVPLEPTREMANAAFVWTNAPTSAYKAMLAAAPSPSASAREPMTDEQRADLLAAALYIAARDDETSVLKEEDAERIVELLSDLSGFELPDVAAVTGGEEGK